MTETKIGLEKLDDWVFSDGVYVSIHGKNKQPRPLVISKSDAATVLEALDRLTNCMKSYYNIMPSRNHQNINDIELSEHALSIMRGNK